MKGQSKLSSLWESIVNTLVGYVVTVSFSPLVYWMCSVELNWKQNFSLAFLFTLLSIARNYVIRRWFNKASVKTEESEEKTEVVETVAPLTLKEHENRLVDAIITKLTNEPDKFTALWFGGYGSPRNVQNSIQSTDNHIHVMLDGDIIAPIRLYKYPRQREVARLIQPILERDSKKAIDRVLKL